MISSLAGLDQRARGAELKQLGRAVAEDQPRRAPRRGARPSASLSCGAAQVGVALHPAPGDERDRADDVRVG